MTRRLLAALGATLALAPAAHAAQSDNVEHVAQLPTLAGAISINFIGDTMFVSTVGGVYAYDVAKPAEPKLLGIERPGAARDEQRGKQDQASPAHCGTIRQRRFSVARACRCVRSASRMRRAAS